MHRSRPTTPPFAEDCNRHLSPENMKCKEDEFASICTTVSKTPRNATFCVSPTPLESSQSESLVGLRSSRRIIFANYMDEHDNLETGYSSEPDIRIDFHSPTRKLPGGRIILYRRPSVNLLDLGKEQVPSPELEPEPEPASRIIQVEEEGVPESPANSEVLMKSVGSGLLLLILFSVVFILVKLFHTHDWSTMSNCFEWDKWNEFLQNSGTDESRSGAENSESVNGKGDRNNTGISITGTVVLVIGSLSFLLLFVLVICVRHPNHLAAPGEKANCPESKRKKTAPAPRSLSHGKSTVFAEQDVTTAHCNWGGRVINQLLSDAESNCSQFIKCRGHMVNAICSLPLKYS
eukprot:946379_1